MEAYSQNVLLVRLYQNLALLDVCKTSSTQLMPDESQLAVSVQKQILKIYFALTQYVLPLDLITKEVK